MLVYKPINIIIAESTEWVLIVQCMLHTDSGKIQSTDYRLQRTTSPTLANKLINESVHELRNPEINHFTNPLTTLPSP